MSCAMTVEEGGPEMRLAQTILLLDQCLELVVVHRMLSSALHLLDSVVVAAGLVCSRSAVERNLSFDLLETGLAGSVSHSAFSCLVKDSFHAPAWDYHHHICPAVAA